MITDHCNSDQSSSDQSSSNQSISNQSNSDQLNANQLSQSQVNQQIEQSINKVCSNENENEKESVEKQTIFENETDTIDLLTSSHKLDALINRKKRAKKQRQIVLKKKFDSIKILTLVLSVDEALKNAQKTLFEDLKIAKIEHVIIQQLINQIERARANLDLTDEASILIDQMQTKKNFEFASIDLTKKSNKKSSYCETMFENFQQLKKTLKQKMTKLMTDQFEKKLIQSQSQSRSNLESSKKKSVSFNAKTQSDAKETSQTSRKSQTARKNSASEKARTNDSTNLTFSSSSSI
jgi:galactitol-specific phosphotransferase system IIB component